MQKQFCSYHIQRHNLQWMKKMYFIIHYIEKPWNSRKRWEQIFSRWWTLDTLLLGFACNLEDFTPKRKAASSFERFCLSRSLRCVIFPNSVARVPSYSLCNGVRGQCVSAPLLCACTYIDNVVISDGLYSSNSFTPWWDWTRMKKNNTLHYFTEHHPLTLRHLLD
jgi:hypothetical protein